MLAVISQGVGRPAQIVRATCLGQEHVKKALAQLRKERRVHMVEGEYRIVEAGDGEG